MLSLLIYLSCFILLFFIIEKKYKIVCLCVISLLSIQLIFSYYAMIGSISDILFYIVILSFIDLLMVLCSIVNNFIIKDYNIFMSLVAISGVFATLLSVFDYYSYYYFQYAPMIIMEYTYFTIKVQRKYVVPYYTVATFLMIPHLIT